MCAFNLAAFLFLDSSVPCCRRRTSARSTSPRGHGVQLVPPEVAAGGLGVPAGPHEGEAVAGALHGHVPHGRIVVVELALVVQVGLARAADEVRALALEHVALGPRTKPRT